tara:strand:+ start:147 stop:725 length:579 start_codon:yes stop_codon:yes gene_type:complete
MRPPSHLQSKSASQAAFSRAEQLTNSIKPYEKNKARQIQIDRELKVIQARDLREKAEREEAERKLREEEEKEEERKRLAAEEEEEKEKEAEKSNISSALPIAREPLYDDEFSMVAEKLSENGNSDDVVGVSKNDEVMRKNFVTLRQGSWLNDEVIHYWYRMLQNRDDKLCAEDSSRSHSHFFKVSDEPHELK